ncbi:50S ribosomal protein L21 [Patescibacteria group bacterium]
MKFAIIKTGGKQYKVSEGDTLDIEKLEGKAKGKVSFDQVLLVADDKTTKIGKPLVKGAKVTGTIVDQFKGEKVRIAKFKAKSRYRKTMGHRQQLTKVKINKITSA